jgi:uncharacterized membrane protein YdjX (TVP38/TMEM64 family)
MILTNFKDVIKMSSNLLGIINHIAYARNGLGLLMERKNQHRRRIVMVALLALTIAALVLLEREGVFTLSYLKQHLSEYQQAFADNPARAIAIYAAIYVAATAVSFPGATLLTLLGGAVFGFWIGTLVVSFAATIGAILAFLASRYLLRDWVRKRFAESMAKIDKGMKDDGDFYLFAMRLNPIVPFFVINLTLGLTPISALRYGIISYFGMIAGVSVYVNAGVKLADLESIRGILSWETILAFALVGLLPLVGKALIKKLQRRPGSKH